MPQKALITGVTGQDGACLAEFLLGKGFDDHGKCIVAVAPRYFRPTEVETLLGDPSKAKDKLGWTPRITFDELVAEMVRENSKVAQCVVLVMKHGYKTMDNRE